MKHPTSHTGTARGTAARPAVPRRTTQTNIAIPSTEAALIDAVAARLSAINGGRWSRVDVVHQMTRLLAARLGVEADPPSAGVATLFPSPKGAARA